LRHSGKRSPRAAPGSSPGIEHAADVDTPPDPNSVFIAILDYGPEQADFYTVEDVSGFMAKERPSWSAVRWINIDGLHPCTINQFRQHFGFHTLAAEDVLHVT
jgi:magnesium transporter